MDGDDNDRRRGDDDDEDAERPTEGGRQRRRQPTTDDRRRPRKTDDGRLRRTTTMTKTASKKRTGMAKTKTPPTTAAGGSSGSSPASLSRGASTAETPKAGLRPAGRAPPCAANVCNDCCVQAAGTPSTDTSGSNVGSAPSCVCLGAFYDGEARNHDACDVRSGRHEGPSDAAPSSRPPRFTALSATQIRSQN